MTKIKLHFPPYFLLTPSAGPHQPKAHRETEKSSKISTARKKPARSARAFDRVPWKKVVSEIKNRQGASFFKMTNVEAPAPWSQLAIDIAASKYFRKSGVPKSKHENSVRQMINRVVDALVASGGKQKDYFASVADSKNFAEELRFILVTQKGAFNSPVWFNAGLWEAYQIKSPSEHFAWDFGKKKIMPTKNAFERPQCSACFIQSVDDSIEGIFELAKTEAKLFKYGSGTGSNFSKWRSKYEILNSGGYSSGLISFLEVLDKGAGAIKSGGTTRRAAKMVCVDIDHPEVIDFIEWKMNEERKAHILIAGGLSAEFEGPAYKTVAGQNANNSVRLTDQFMNAVLQKKDWSLRGRSDGKIIQKIPATEIWQKIVRSAWVCADPGVQFHDTINQWHTCAQTDEIQASNPCSEYMFLDDSACNLSSINLVQFLGATGEFDFEGFIHTARTLFVAQEILVDYSSYPTEKIAQNSHDFRPLGLGYANLGSLLMRKGIAYDSPAGRAWAATITALLTGVAYLTSAEMARAKGPFAGFKKNKTSMLKVMKRHQAGLKKIEWEHLPDGLEAAARTLWQSVVYNGEKYGYRNAQATVIAPTGTIGLLMDCDTTGIEPDFSLIKFKKLVGGGEIQIINQSVEIALQALKYTPEQIERILKYIEKNNGVEGSPDLSLEHLAVFDCASSSPGGRVLSPQSHVLMMAAVQPFVSGAISKTVNLPSNATEKDISDIYLLAWKSGVKAVAIYRDGSKQSQPLNLKSSEAAQEADGLNSTPPAPRSKTDPEPATTVNFTMKCPDCGSDTVLTSGCYRCPNCGTTVGCS